MSISLQALWLLCGMGAAVFSAGPAHPRRVGALAIGFGLAAWAFRGGYPPDAATVAGIAAIVAGLGLYRPAWVSLPAFFGGFLAAALAALLETQGVMAPVALVCSALIPISTFAVSAPAPVLEEGRLLVLAFGLASAIVPAVLDGWQSAGALNVAVASNQSLPLWVLSVTGAAVVIGGMWSAWRHQ